LFRPSTSFLTFRKKGLDTRHIAGEATLFPRTAIPGHDDLLFAAVLSGVMAGLVPAIHVFIFQL